MAKKKTIKEDSSMDLMDDFNKSFGAFLEKEAKIDMSSLEESITVPFFIDTGSYATNWIISNDMINGGFPATKLTMVIGESGKGKSLMAIVGLGNNIRLGGNSVNIDIEKSVNSKEFVGQIVGSEEIASKIQLIKPSPDKNGSVRPITIEKLNSVLNKMIDYQLIQKSKKSKSLCVLIDSFSALTSNKEYDDTRNDKDVRDMTAQQEMRKMLRVVTQTMEDANMTMLGIGQMTANIGVMYGPKTTMSAKGSGPGYWASLILQMVSDKEILDKETGIPVGIKMRLKTTKNRIKFKGRDAWLHFYFSRGIDPYGGLAELLAVYGVFKPSTKKSVTNDFTETTKFTYTTDAGKELNFKARQMGKIVEENGGIEFIKELNDKLNDVFESKMKNVSPEEFLDTDEIDEDIDEIEDFSEQLDEE